VTNLIFKRLSEGTEKPRYRWDALLNPEPTRTNAVASAAEQGARKITPKTTAGKSRGSGKKDKAKEATT